VRPRVAVYLAAVVAALGSGLVACFDLLHDTGDLRTACAIDAGTPGCPAVPSVSLCAPSRSAAAESAEHACAWLGACETPMGKNAVGTCMFAALAAFDCEANPSHPATGAQVGLWRCLAAAQTCGDVDGCVFPAGPQPCAAKGAPADYTSCGTAGTGSGPNDMDVRVECVDGGVPPYPKANGESCALWGETCSVDPSGGTCAPSRTPGCAANECAGSTITWCAGGTNVGIDCASWGSRACAGYPTTEQAAWVACVPETDAGATCTPDASSTCAGGVATSCPAGVIERIDCDALLGASNAPAACHAGALDPPFDWTSPCAVAPPACTSDTCDGGVAIGCARGAVFSVDCRAAGLGDCSMRSTDLGTKQHAACAPPAP
jgi:hypothetical protein